MVKYCWKGVSIIPNNFNLNISGEDMIKIFSVLITVISTYFVAKYNSNTPRRLKIKQKQLDKVYLPIYKLLLPNIGSDISKETAFHLSTNIQNILFDNYEFAYPTLHLLIKKFNSDINSNSNYQETFNKICYQVGIDYDLLKKSLGYPSENLFGIFRRMTVQDKFTEILGWINVCFLFGPIILIPLSVIPFISRNFSILLIANYSFFLLLLIIQMHKQSSLDHFLKETNNINRTL